MKKTLIKSTIILIVIVSSIACTSNKQEIDANTIDVNFTAYKTTDKVGVKGSFKEIQLTKVSEGTTAQEVLNGTEFSIPVSSLFTNNDARDTKIKMYFFGIMKNTEALTGAITTSSESEGTIHLTMNGETKGFPITFSQGGNKVTLNGTIQLENWNALEALESLNKVCFELHKGADGVSKTWSEVSITSSFDITTK